MPRYHASTVQIPGRPTAEGLVGRTHTSTFSTFTWEQRMRPGLRVRPFDYLGPGPGAPLGRAGLAVAGLNLSGCAHWAEGMQHGLLLLEGLLLHALDLSALLAARAGLAADAPLARHPAVRQKRKSPSERWRLCVVSPEAAATKGYPPHESPSSTLAPLRMTHTNCSFIDCEARTKMASIGASIMAQ